MLVFIPYAKIFEILLSGEIKIENWFYLKFLISFLIYGFSLNLTDVITIPILEKEETSKTQIALSEDDDNL